MGVRTNTIVMIGLAAVCGLLAVSAGRTYLDQQSAARLEALKAQRKPAQTATLLVAAAPLRHGTEITRQHLREIPWPDNALPQGAFRDAATFFAGDVKRVALAGIVENEPLLASKVTGPGQRATLSAIIADGRKAITVRVNDVQGVGGFVLPGDHVDVLLTRQKDEGEGNYTDVVTQNVRVLGVDQLVDDKADKPVVVKAVTLEVAIADAQKLTLAASLGTLSLTLRAAGEPVLETTRRVTVEDLAQESTVRPPAIADVPTATLPPRNTSAKVGVIRGVKREDYTVPFYAGN